MPLSFGGAQLRVKNLYTTGGTKIVDSTGVIVARGGLKDSSGNSVVGSDGLVNRSKVAVPFNRHSILTNTTTYAGFSPHATNQIGAQFAYIPWACSVLGLQAQISPALSAGHITVTLLNGTTATAGYTITLNTTKASTTNTAVGTVDAVDIGAERLRVKIKSSADAANGGTLAVGGIVWVSA